MVEGELTTRADHPNPTVAPILSRLPAQVQRDAVTGALAIASGMDAKYQGSFRRCAELVKRMWDRKIPIVAGTDAWTGFALHRELELYADAGNPNADRPAIAIAGLRPSAQVGTALDCSNGPRHATIGTTLASIEAMQKELGGEAGANSVAPSVRRAARRLARLATLSALLYPSTARADDGYPNVGLFVGYSFGEKASVEWGIDASYVVLTRGERSCSDDVSRLGYGPMLKVSLFGLSRPKITLGGFAGSELRPRGPSVIGELGGSMRFDDKPRWGLHTGGLLEMTWPEVYARQDWFLEDYSFGLGLHYSPTFGLPEKCYEPVPIAGRPLRDGAGRVVETAMDDEHDLASETRAWLADAQAECASIPALLGLARELLLVGAPIGLVDHALDAAEDELRHAEICGAIASRLAGRALRPRLPSPTFRPAAGRQALLVRLATESFLDGCLGEGAASERARNAARATRDPLLSRAHRRIATDEARHAELGWDVATFALDAGGAPVRRGLDATLELTACARDPWGCSSAARQRLTRVLRA